MTLVVLMDGQVAGAVKQNRAGELTLTYDDEWRASTTSTPLSVSMPLTQRTHDDAIRPYLLGLLPDNERVLERWARSYHASARNPFALLGHVGEDCAGAVQFVTPDRVEAQLARDGGVTWMSEAEIADRIRLLRRDPAAWHVATTGNFSLGGAQSKTALYHDETTDRWGAPWGAVPTTHILKPAITGLDDHDLNEHMCLAAARHLGLDAAASRVASFAGERVIVIDRYDRTRRADGTVDRLHQEDLCQALGIPPVIKYQSEGGPSPEQIIALLRAESADGDAEVRRFVDALAFNWIIAGTDAHAKNYSLLLAGRQVRLAPLYDLASALPYDDMYAPKLRMAMRIGGEYRVAALRARHWRRLAEAAGLDPDATVARVDELAARTPEAVKAAAAPGADGDLAERLCHRVTAHAERCRAALAEG
ncbi:type II toxin-antitoxin system HipA family toxin [Phytohabitans sp. ZYX-F-186]|uniref:Type II toxin-antitoxin system HipA family toxin n=1 Tax=Phytohabitans maris TaxID=3071409 RepID=A0ABU0ZNB0_9ACTN|nr:type II toxin-antitoxin system HipA family toxin [Phytohabitans sp. ZYX-F-186]MDQ7907745.1 type II toxin-antitoxin system HipA family toxin [Phytohabitans sp. ZYX-F-186]